MKIMSWNINGRSRNITDNAADFIAENLPVDFEVIVFTEYTLSSGKLCSNLEKYGYITHSNVTQKKENGILIAVKSDDIEIKRVFKLRPSKNDMQPNFLGVQLKKDNELLNIVGTRIRIDTKKAKTIADGIHDFKDRARQSVNLFQQLDLNQIKGKTIIVGDFNNGFYKKNDNLSDYNGKVREFFNYLMLKNMMNEKEFEAYTPKYGYSWNKVFKLDHAFAKGLHISQYNYNWDFKQNPFYKEEVGIPDHAQLLIEIPL